MKLTPRTLLVALLSLPAAGSGTLGLADEISTTTTVSQMQLPMTETETMNVPITAKTPEPVADDTKEELDTPEFPIEPAVEAGEEKKPIGNITTVPVSGAFGIPLGERFAPYLVDKVLAQDEHRYHERDENKTEHTGTLYRVEPNLPNPNFNEYTVLTNKDGVIYSITGKQSGGKSNLCEQTKEIAIFLMDKYGKPRGRGLLGDWFSFRESEEGPYKGIRFYAQRCRNGRYQIIYSDDGAMMQEATPEEGTEQTRGL